MTDEILIGVLSLVGTLGGSFAGIVTSAKLTAYRIAQLEKKVDRHNGFAERIPIIEEKLKVASNRLTDLEGKVFK